MSNSSRIKVPKVSVKYFNKIASAAKTSSSRIIMNPDFSHAELALIFLYATARRSVKIFCGDMNENHIPSLRLQEKWTSLVLNDKIHLEVITQNPDSKAFRMSFLRDHIDVGLNNEIHPLDEDQYQELLNAVDGHRDFHFTTVDGIAYRYEYDTIDHKAYVNFHDRTTTQKLEHYFELLNKDKVGRVITSEINTPQHLSA